LIQLFGYFFGFNIRRLKSLRKNEGYIVGRDFPVPKHFINSLPRGWSDEASRFMKNYVLELEEEIAEEDEEEKQRREEELNKRIIELRKQGLSYRQIAAALGISRWRVSKCLSGRKYSFPDRQT